MWEEERALAVGPGSRPSREALRAQVGSTHIEAASGSSDWETQDAFLFYGPKDLGKETPCRKKR